MDDGEEFHLFDAAPALLRDLFRRRHAVAQCRDAQHAAWTRHPEWDTAGADRDAVPTAVDGASFALHAARRALHSRGRAGLNRKEFRMLYDWLLGKLPTGSLMHDRDSRILR